MVTVLFLLPSAGAQNSGMRVMSPENSHSRYGGVMRSSGWKIGTHKPPPIGSTEFRAASMANISRIWASFSGISAARSWAWDQSSSR